MGSGIKGLKKGGIRDHSLGSGITALGIGISVFSIDSRINIHWDQQNTRFETHFYSDPIGDFFSQS